MPHFFFPPPGPVAVISQSGNVQGLMINALMDVGVGVSKGVSSGNEADLKSEDYFAFLADDPETEVILSYVEGVENGRRFLDIARETARKKPIVLLKGGESEFGVAAAKTHTGSMAVSTDLFEAACRQAGVIRARSIFESAIIAASFVNRPLPRGRRVGIVTGGGGLGVIASDLCARAGLTLPRFSDATVQKIAAKLPPWWAPGNPVDLVAGLNFQVVPSILETIMASGEIDCLLLLFQGPKGQSDEEIKPRNPQTEKMIATWKQMRSMAHGFGMLLNMLMKKTGVPVLAVSDFASDTPEAIKLKFKPAYSIFHPDIETAVAAAAAMARCGEIKAR
jgi:acyl-CoA synthetase (NDP forming)